jgi:hypothetical protein
VHTKPEIYATNSRSLLAYMNQMKYAIEYRVALTEQLEDINYSEIEDLLSDMLLSSGGPGNMRNQRIYCTRLLINEKASRYFLGQTKCSYFEAR